MMSSKNTKVKPEKGSTAQIPAKLREQANLFLNSRKGDLKLLEKIIETPITSSDISIAVLQTLEVIFKNLLIRGDLGAIKRKKDHDAEHNKKLDKYYEQTWGLIIERLQQEETLEANAALTTGMTLLATEAKHPLPSGLSTKKTIPKDKLKNILAAIIKPSTSGTNQSQYLIEQLQRYTKNLDILETAWSVLPDLATQAAFKSDAYILNYLAVINTLDMRKSVLDASEYLNKSHEEEFNYDNVRKSLTSVWNKIMKSVTKTLEEQVHRQLLVILLERILAHLNNPVLLTDFLMNSLGCGGAISLLALQGIYTLIQKHNITYPDVYDKLYAMFEAKIFHTKFKARLFYLADIFLSSTHLPLNLVAAFVKRLARLSLVAPPQDAIIIIHFMCNLLMRHTGVMRLVAAPSAEEISEDPYDDSETDPIKSKAIQSSLWEMVILQKHAIPSVATAARMVLQPMPTKEFDLAEVLEVKETDIFDGETKKEIKQFALAYETPKGLFLPHDDVVKTYWKLF